jgi:TonB family protein
VPHIRRLATFWLLLASLSLCPSAVNAADPASSGHRAVITRVAPTYPELARRMHVSGTVIVRIVILPNGNVSEVHIQSGHPLLGEAAQQAVTQWRFVPGPDTTSQDINIVFAPN